MPHSDPLAREVDRLLANLSPDAWADSVAPVRPAPASVPNIRTSGPAQVAQETAAAVALWARAFLGMALGTLMTQWPYGHRCGWPLVGYLSAVAIVMFAAGWIGFTSWRMRSGAAHLVALVLFFWGIILAAEQLLPRIGYAAVPATWECTVQPTR